MRRMLYGGIGLLTISALAMSAANAQKPSAERELLGIRVMQDYKKVLSRHGQPTRIESGAAATTVGGQQASTGMAGGSGVGLPALGGMGMSSPMGMTAPMGMSSPMGMTGPMGASSGMSAMMGARGMMGGPMGMTGAPGLDEEGQGSRPSMMGGSGMMGAPPMMGGSGMMGRQMAQAEVNGEGEVTWIYDRGQNTYVFLFNKDGRVIQVQSFGYANGGKTAAGIALGDQVAKIYRTYGWPDQIEKSGDSITLDYSRESHVAFQLVDRHNGKGSRVVGITVALTEPRNPAGLLHMAGFGGSTGTAGAGAMGTPGGMMGGPMVGGGMMSSPMSGMRPGMMSPGGMMGPGMMTGGMNGGGGKKQMMGVMGVK